MFSVYKVTACTEGMSHVCFLTLCPAISIEHVQVATRVKQTNRDAKVVVLHTRLLCHPEKQSCRGGAESDVTSDDCHCLLLYPVWNLSIQMLGLSFSSKG